MSEKFNYEYQLTTKLISLLRSKGYDPSTLRMEWTQDNARFDLAILDPQSTELLALFEIKLQSRAIVSSADLRKSLAKYANIATKLEVPLYLISAREGSESYTINLVTPESRNDEHPIIVDIDSADFPSFVDLKTRIVTDKRRETMDSFSKLSWCSAIFALILLILDISKLLPMTPSRLMLVGAIIGLLLLPKANRLKILGFEFERLENK